MMMKESQVLMECIPLDNKIKDLLLQNKRKSTTGGFIMPRIYTKIENLSEEV